MDRWDWMCAAGLVLLAAGIGWWVHPAAALVTLGVGVLYVGWHRAPISKRAAGERPE